MLAGLESFCSVYIDDIIVFSETVEEHGDHLCQIFQRLRKFHLKRSTNLLGQVWGTWDMLSQWKAAHLTLKRSWQSKVSQYQHQSKL